jgi:aarF domain-containing kinase
MLLTASKILPKGMFLDRTVEVMKAELADECSYTREASFLQMFRKQDFLGDDPRFKVPWVWEGSTDGVLVMERVEGISVGEAQKLDLKQEDRNEVRNLFLPKSLIVDCFLMHATSRSQQG